MGKLKQHYMIKLKEGEIHPLFRLAYLPENLASFMETLLLFLEGSMIMLFCLNLIIGTTNISVLGSLPLFMINKVSTIMLGFLRLPNARPYDLLAIVVMVVIYALTRNYFEHIKYNLHVARNSINIKSAKTPKSKNTA